MDKFRIQIKHSIKSVVYSNPFLFWTLRSPGGSQLKRTCTKWTMWTYVFFGYEGFRYKESHRNHFTNNVAIKQYLFIAGGKRMYTVLHNACRKRFNTHCLGWTMEIRPKCSLRALHFD